MLASDVTQLYISVHIILYSDNLIFRVVANDTAIPFSYTVCVIHTHTKCNDPLSDLINLYQKYTHTHTEKKILFIY